MKQTHVAVQLETTSEFQIGACAWLLLSHAEHVRSAAMSEKAPGTPIGVVQASSRYMSWVNVALPAAVVGDAVVGVTVVGDEVVGAAVVGAAVAGAERRGMAPGTEALLLLQPALRLAYYPTHNDMQS